MAEEAVVQSIDAPTIYQVPLLMHEQKLDETILAKMNLPVADKPQFRLLKKFLERRGKATETVNIGLVGKYVELPDAL